MGRWRWDLHEDVVWVHFENGEAAGADPLGFVADFCFGDGSSPRYVAGVGVLCGWRYHLTDGGTRPVGCDDEICGEGSAAAINGVVDCDQNGSVDIGHVGHSLSKVVDCFPVGFRGCRWFLAVLAGVSVEVCPQSIIQILPAGHAHWVIDKARPVRVTVDELDARAVERVWLPTEIVILEEFLNLRPCSDTCCMAASNR